MFLLFLFHTCPHWHGLPSLASGLTHLLRQCLILKLKGISECDAKKMPVEVVFEVRSTWTLVKSSVFFQSHEKSSWCCRERLMILYSTLSMTRKREYLYYPILNMYCKKHILWMMWWLFPLISNLGQIPGTKPEANRIPGSHFLGRWRFAGRRSELLNELVGDQRIFLHLLKQLFKNYQKVTFRSSECVVWSFLIINCGQNWLYFIEQSHLTLNRC